jgi:hypothetical protein
MSSALLTWRNATSPCSVLAAPRKELHEVEKINSDFYGKGLRRRKRGIY